MNAPRDLVKQISLLAALFSCGFAEAQEPKKMLHPDFPVIEGKYQMTDNWSVTLDQKHNRRIEEGSLVIWRPGFTIWTRVWNLKEGETAEERLKSLRADISKEATDVVESREGMPLRLSYRLKEKSEDDRQAAFYGVVVSASGHVHVAIYFDDAKDLKTAQEIFASLTPAKAEAKAKEDGGQPAKRPEGN